MRNTGLRAGYPQIELDRTVDGHEQPRRHRNRRKDQHHRAAREKHAVGEQETEHAARGAHCRICRSARERRDHELRERSRYHAGEVIDNVAALAEDPLDRGTEHVEREHVEHEMHQAAVQEAVGDDLPGQESHGSHCARAAERPKGEERDELLCRHRLHQEYDAVDEKQQPGDRRDSVHRFSLRVTCRSQPRRG